MDTSTVRPHMISLALCLCGFDYGRLQIHYHLALQIPPGEGLGFDFSFRKLAGVVAREKLKDGDANHFWNHNVVMAWGGAGLAKRLGVPLLNQSE